MGVFNGQQAPGAGEEDIVKIPAVLFAEVKDPAVLPGFVIVDPAAVQQIALQKIYGLRFHGQSRLTIIDTIKRALQSSGGKLRRVGRCYTQMPAEDACRIQQPFLPPMDICAIVIFCRQNFRQIDERRPGKACLKSSKKAFIVHSQMTAFLCEIVAFVRNDGHMDIRTGESQIFVIKMLKPIQCMIHGIRIQRIFLLYRIAVCKINAVVIAVLQTVKMKQGFDFPESIPQWELIQRIAFKCLHKAAAPEGIRRYFRHLCQGTALCFRNIFRRNEPGPSRQHRPQAYHRRKPQGA